MTIVATITTPDGRTYPVRYEAYSYSVEFAVYGPNGRRHVVNGCSNDLEAFRLTKQLARKYRGDDTTGWKLIGRLSFKSAGAVRAR
jgi:hypothetical protein